MQESKLSLNELERLSQLIETDGFVVIKELCSKSFCDQLLHVCQSKLHEALTALGDRQIGIGSKAGYKEIVQRSKGRWDVPIHLQDLKKTLSDFPWFPIVASLLGEDCEAVFQGVVASMPDATDQYWHIDSAHTESFHSKANILNVLIALNDIPLEMGPTELAIGSHRQTNHLKNTNLIVEQLVYQYKDTNPHSLKNAEDESVCEPWTTAMLKGSTLIFDDRLLHRGLANKTKEIRYVAYFSISRKGYATDTYFESTKSLHKNT